MRTNEQIKAASDWIDDKHKYCSNVVGCPEYVTKIKKQIPIIETIREVLTAAINPWNYNMDEAPKDGSEYLAKNKYGAICVCHWDLMEWVKEQEPRVFPMSDAIAWCNLPPNPPEKTKDTETAI